MSELRFFKVVTIDMHSDFNSKRIWVAGHNGMVGRMLARQLESECSEVLTCERKDVDLTNQKHVEDWIRDARPDGVIIASAKVGGILANSKYPADFIYDNLMIASNIIHASFKTGVEKLTFLGSSCIYPRDTQQPIKENQLLSGHLEQTNEWYAIAKIAGIKLCQAYRKQHGCDFISAMPTNLYGPNDNFDISSSHVIPALLRKCHEAHHSKSDTFEVWGTGAAKREFLHVADCARGIIYLHKHYSGDQHINIGTGKDISIKELCYLICKIVGYNGDIIFDKSKPDGTLRKLLDTTKINKFGWHPEISLEDGLKQTYKWYIENSADLRA